MIDIKKSLWFFNVNVVGFLLTAALASGFPSTVSAEICTTAETQCSATCAEGIYNSEDYRTANRICNFFGEEDCNKVNSKLLGQYDQCRKEKCNISGNDQCRLDEEEDERVRCDALKGLYGSGCDEEEKSEDSKDDTETDSGSESESDDESIRICGGDGNGNWRCNDDESENKPGTEPTQPPGTRSGGGSGGGGEGGDGGSGGPGGPDGGGPGGPGPGGPDGGGPGGPDGGGPSGPGPGGPDGGGPDGPNGPPIPPKICKENSCAEGDPHLVSGDGVRYDFQAVGEFILGYSEPLETTIQARLSPFGSTGNLSIVTAVAVQANRARITIDVNRQRSNLIEIDGRPVQLRFGIENAVYDRSGYYITRHSNGVYEIWTPQNVQLRVWAGSTNLSVDFKFPYYAEATVTGLLGQIDGDQDNDFTMGTGEVIAHNEGSLSYDDLYRRFGNSWRVTQEESLFDYADGESVETFADLSFPRKHLKLADLDEEARANAETICQNAGVSEGPQSDDCLYDVGFSGDAVFAEGYAVGEQVLILSAPYSVTAGSAYPVFWSGPVNDRDYIALATPESARGNEYDSFAWANKNAEPVELVAPAEPGDFELRYVLGSNDQIIKRSPLRVEPPTTTLSAPQTVKAGSTFTVEWTGPANNSDYIALAKPESERGSQYESYSWVNAGGTPVTLTAPKEPGTYELRYVLRRDDTIIARRKINIE